MSEGSLSPDSLKHLLSIVVLIFILTGLGWTIFVFELLLFTCLYVHFSIIPWFQCKTKSYQLGVYNSPAACLLGQYRVSIKCLRLEGVLSSKSFTKPVDSVEISDEHLSFPAPVSPTLLKTWPYSCILQDKPRVWAQCTHLDSHLRVCLTYRSFDRSLEFPPPMSQAAVNVTFS